MKIKFSKMHGLGNDFILIDQRVNPLDVDWIKVTPRLCDRNLGIGADGVLLVYPSSTADQRMEIINSDGSIPEMCGNGIRCFAKYIYDHGDKDKEILSVETGAGIMVPALDIQNGKVVGVEVDMGEPIFEPAKIPVKGFTQNPLLNQKIKVKDQEFIFSAVSMGNPHIVIYTENLKELPLSDLGPLLEHHEFFPARTNVHFVQLVSKDEIHVRHWERGAGETLACGTGACACAVLSSVLGLTERKLKVYVPGGLLRIEWGQENNHVSMQGPAMHVFDGEFEIG